MTMCTDSYECIKKSSHMVQKKALGVQNEAPWMGQGRGLEAHAKKESPKMKSARFGGQVWEPCWL